MSLPTLLLLSQTLFLLAGFVLKSQLSHSAWYFSLQSEKCVKAVEGHTYYNKTKERNNRASILKSSNIQHIIALVISVWIRRVAGGRRLLNPAAPFSIHNERDAGVLFPSPFLPLCVALPEHFLANTLLCHGAKEVNGLVGICSGTPGRGLTWRDWAPQLICSLARLQALQPPSPILIVQMFLSGACD